MSNTPINFTGHHVEVTPALREYTKEKFQRLQRRGDHITHISVTFNIEKLRQIAKATLHVKGKEIHASDESSDMYVAIDGLVDKLEKQISKHRDGVVDHHE